MYDILKDAVYLEASEQHDIIIQKDLSIIETYLQEFGYEILYIETGKKFMQYSIAIWLTPEYVIACNIPYCNTMSVVMLNWSLNILEYPGPIDIWPHYSNHKHAKVYQYGMACSLQETLKNYKKREHV